MCARHLLSTLLLAPALIWGQVSANTITVSVSADSSQQPNQAFFSVVVDSRIDQISNLSLFIDKVGAGWKGVRVVGVFARGVPFAYAQNVIERVVVGSLAGFSCQISAGARLRSRSRRCAGRKNACSARQTGVDLPV